MPGLLVEQVGISTGEPSSAMRAILRAVRAQSPENTQLTPQSLRRSDLLAPFALPPSAGVSCDLLTADDGAGWSVPVHHYRPSGAADPLPVLVFAHGGCFVFGTPGMYEGICSYLALKAACSVLVVDYRLAPEHPFPAAVEDVCGVVRWVQREGAGLGLDPSRLSLAGDSAGGNLAAVTSLVLRARGAVPACLQILFYPITNLADLATPSYAQFAEGFLSRELMSWSRDQYVPEAQRQHPWVSPLLEPDLAKLPRTLLISAELDVLRDEAEAFGARLLAAGSPVRALRYNGLEHAFVSMAGALDAGLYALDVAASELCASSA